MIRNFYYAFQDIHFTYQVTLSILSIGLFISSLEDLINWPVFESNGLLSWKVARLASRWSVKGNLAKIADKILSDCFFKVTIYLRLMGAALLFVLSLYGVISSLLLLLLFSLKLLVNLRNPYGLDGAYQMYLVILFSLTIGSFFGVGSTISILSLGFIASELILSYFIAGVTKLCSPMWIKSHAMVAIFSTRNYGHSFFYEIFSKVNFLSLSSSWIVILFETLFFLILFLNPDYTLALLAMGLIFHFFNAAFMGLNDFLFAFTATYPALIYCKILMD